MKKLMVVLAAMVMVFAMVSGAFADTATDTVQVNAKVKSVCTNTVTGAFSTLTIDPSSAATTQPFTVATPASIQCSKNVTSAKITAASTHGTSSATPVTCNGSANFLTGFTMQDTNSKTIDYSFACASTITGNGFGTAGDGTHDQSLGIAAEVLQADAQAADYDGGAIYNDVVTLTVTY